ncbi:hypothetical protein [Streptomyces bacillaris]|uniref:hypothetical protein n=1 Tax=Streptomyces bacillaris TaxID=68179 RepID=UPI003460A825
MSTQTIGTTPPQPTKGTDWKTGQRTAVNATHTVIDLPTTAQPLFTCQKTWGRQGGYVGEVGYLLLAPLLEIAAAYDVPVTELPALGGGTTYKVVAPVDGTTVTIWTTDPADAATAVAE